MADFGMASTSMVQPNFGGSPRYMAPEVAIRESKNPKHQNQKPEIDFRSDTWSLGVMAREMLTGAKRLPGIGNDVRAANKQLQTKIAEFGDDKNNRVYAKNQDPNVKSINNFHQLINAMQHPDPSQRPTLEAIAQHHFVTDPIVHSPEIKPLLSKLTQLSKLNEKREKLTANINHFSDQIKKKQSENLPKNQTTIQHLKQQIQQLNQQIQQLDNQMQEFGNALKPLNDELAKQAKQGI
jgi:serine/threonine protein kinase